MKSPLPTRPFRALAGAIALWLTGMIIGIFAFSIPAGREASPIPNISGNPFISGPILVIWPLITWILATRFARRTENPATEGIRIGLVFLVVNVLLDRVIVVGIMGAGPGFYSYAALWVAYSMLVVIPWIAGRARSPKQ
jgi:hypothetical protein